VQASTSASRKPSEKRWQSLPEIKKVDGIFGRFDIIAEVEAKDAGELSRLVTDKIKAIPSVVSTETFICH
jgi:DNA-binding Lrp family transcriptional regulator